MATVKVYDQNKQECGELTLSADVFEVEARPEILNLVVRAQMAAKRAGTHMAKTRAFVSGGGVKPWKQKGTGRARSGSNRSPVWRGGAIVFGPQPRDYSFKVNSKVRALAMKMALSSRLAAENLLVVKGIELPEAKTKHFAKVAGTLGLNKALIVTDTVNKTLVGSANNIPGVKTSIVGEMNTYDVLNSRKMILTVAAVDKLEEVYAK